MSRSEPRSGTDAGVIVVVHADESCLGNGMERPSPGGAAALVERRSADGIARKDLYISAPDTTNNRMALCGAIAVLACLSNQERHLKIAYVSDSEYLVKGMNEWAPAWEKRGWKRKGGAVENLELWQTLVQVSRQHRVSWRWTRGHAGNPKNEYANDCAIRAAERQQNSPGLVDSEFSIWLSQRQGRGRFTGFDPAAEFTDMEQGMIG